MGISTKWNEHVEQSLEFRNKEIACSDNGNRYWRMKISCAHLTNWLCVTPYSWVNTFLNNGYPSCYNKYIYSIFLMLTKRIEKKLDGYDIRMLQTVFGEILKATSHKTVAVQSLTTHLKKHPSRTNKTYGTHSRRSKVTFVYGPLHRDAQVLANKQELIYFTTMRILDVVWKTCK